MAIFVDTGAWFAASVVRDPDHRAAKSFLLATRERLVTSDLVYAELLTLFRIRGQMLCAAAWVDQVRRGRCTLVRATEQDVTNATDVFLQFRDKRWSFCDCMSRAMMGRLGISTAFAFDAHFRQFGTITVLP